MVLVGLRKGLAICRKNEDYQLNFNNQKTVSVNEDINCIVLRESIQIAFLGTSDGKVLFSSYPFNPFE